MHIFPEGKGEAVDFDTRLEQVLELIQHQVYTMRSTAGASAQ